MNLFNRRRAMMAAVSVLKKFIVTAVNGIVSFITNVAMPTKVTCEFSPVQSGTGDPSPSNVRSISGWTGCEISHSGADTSNPSTKQIKWLPSEYQQVEYIESNKNAYFWSDVPIQDGLTVDAVQAFNGNDTFLLGGYDDSGNNRSSFNGTYSGKIQGAYPKTYYNVGSGILRDNTTFYHVVTTHKNGIRTVYVDDVRIYNNSGWGTVNQTGAKCAIFAARKANPVGTDEVNMQYAYSGKVKSLKILKDDVLLANYIPCYRKSDSKNGMYDTVQEKFYSSESGTEFTKGSDVTSPGTVYGGTVTLNEDGGADLEVIPGYIASYNGETLSNNYISSQAAPNTTPVTGSQVFDFGAAPVQTYHFPSIGELQSFIGQNAIWHDMNGSITVEYYKNT